MIIFYIFYKKASQFGIDIPGKLLLYDFHQHATIFQLFFVPLISKGLRFKGFHYILYEKVIEELLN